MRFCQHWVMSGGMDLALLREFVGSMVAVLPDHYSHRELAGACEQLGLPEPPGEDEALSVSADGG